MPEIWLDVVGFVGLYQVSNLGQIKRTHTATSTFSDRILKPYVGKLGYHRITLFKNGKRHRYQVARIVCTMFNGPPPLNHEANHIDEDKSNNKADNLEWLASQKNKEHSYNRSKKKNFFKRKTYIFIAPNGVIFHHTGLRDFCSKNGLSATAICLVLNKKYKHHKGWKCERCLEHE